LPTARGRVLLNYGLLTPISLGILSPARTLREFPMSSYWRTSLAGCTAFTLLLASVVAATSQSYYQRDRQTVIDQQRVQRQLSDQRRGDDLRIRQLNQDLRNQQLELDSRIKRQQLQDQIQRQQR
jgi:hypothetical protein